MVYLINPDRTRPWNQLAEMGIVERREISGGHYYMNLELYRVLGQ